MGETIGNVISGLPKNGDKILFAQDFVNHALIRYKLPELPLVADHYRHHVYNAFDPTMRDAVNFLYNQIEMEVLQDFHFIIEHHRLDRNTFENYVASLGTRYLGSGFDAEKLLIFCAKITKMALKFYCNGLGEGPPLVMQRIINILDSYDMASGGWEQLNCIATKYASLYEALGKPPDSSESEYGSGSVSNYSESNFSEVSTSTQETAASCSRAASTSEVTSSTRNDVPNQLQLPSTSLPSSSRSSGLVFTFEFDTPSSSGVKPRALVITHDVGGSSGSLPMDGTEEYDSDVFDDDLEAMPLRPNFCPNLQIPTRRSSKKRPVSPSSSAAGCSAAVEPPEVSSSSSAANPACQESLNRPSSANSGGTSASMSPDHEPSSKIRKHC